MKFYEVPETEIVKFSAIDVGVTSAEVTEPIETDDPNAGDGGIDL